MKVSRFVAASIALGVFGLGFMAGTDPRGLAVGFLDCLARVSFWGVILVACARLAARAVGSRLTGLAHVVWDGTAGLALLIALLLTVGLFPGGFRATTVRLVVLAVAATAAAVAWRDRVSRFRGLERADLPTRGLMCLLSLVTIAGLAWDRVPPVFFDTRAYHFAFPELWLVTGRIAPQTWSLHSWFPPGMSVLYGVGLASGFEPWANDANLLVGLCLVAAAFDLARRLFGTATGLLAGAFVTALPLTLYAFAIPAADLGHGLFVFGSLACVMLRSTDDPSWLKRASLLAAGAVLTKYLGLMVPLAVGVVWIGAWPSSSATGSRMRARIADAFRFSVPAVLLVLPWLASNVVAVGNPVAPTASSVFSTRGLAPGGAESFSRDARGGLPDWHDVRSLTPRWFTGSDVDGRIYPTPAFGLLPLLLAPLALVAARDDRKIRGVLGWAFVLIVIWFLTFRWERFLVAAATILSIAVAEGVVVTSRRSKVARLLPLATVLAAAVSILPAAIEIGRFTGGVRVAAGLGSAREFIEGGLPSVRLFRRANEMLDPRRSRILLLGEMRHYGLSADRTAPTGFNTHPLVEALRDAPSPEAANRSLRHQGFTHVIADPGWITRSAAQYPSLSYFRDHPEALPSYLESLGEPMATEGGVQLFKIPG